MDDRSIAWMLSGGTRFETADERHARMHASTIRAAREAAAATERRGPAAPGLLVRAKAALGLAVAGLAPTTGPDCCVA
jgi:hypothetical protein